MHHFVVHTAPGRRLFHTWEEGCELWRRLAAAMSGLRAMCVMPDHVHVLHEGDVRRALGDAMSGHARWMNAREGRSGALLRRSPPPSPVVGRDKLRRDIRYIHLNPCRARLVRDPLAWPLSTHLDAVGLAVSPVLAAWPDPHGLHRYVSGDPTVHVDGTELPVPPCGLVTLDGVLRAVSLATRTPGLEVIERRGPARTLFVSCAKGLTGATGRQIASFAGVSVSTVKRAVPSTPAAIAALAVDRRVHALDDVHLRAMLDGYFGWRRREHVA